MDSEDIVGLFAPLSFLATVEAVRQDYQIFRTAAGDYLVFSPSSRGEASFHMTFVSKEKVEAVEKTITKSGVTSSSLLKDERVLEAFGSKKGPGFRFDLLMSLYILTAMGVASMEKSGRSLLFTRRESDA